MKTLSIVVPVYNEEKTLVNILDQLVSLKIDLKKEIIVVDDGSKDSSKKIVEDYIKKNKKEDIRLFSKENGGKGSAIRLGFKKAKGDIITVQDADLEYDPKEYVKLVKPILSGEYRVVYGSRFLKKHRPRYRIYFWGNKFLSLLTKVLYANKITDMETCYKVFDSRVLRDLDLKANKFDIEPEVTAKILKKGIKIKEISINYSPRSIEEGKKINWKDGLQAIYTLLKLRVF